MTEPLLLAAGAALASPLPAVARLPNAPALVIPGGMSSAAGAYGSLDDWIAREAVAFSPSAKDALAAAVDRVIATLGDGVELLGLGEALHGGEEFLVLRNRLFARLALAHGYTAIAVESSFPRGHVVNEYVAGDEAGSYEAISDAGFSHRFGALEANRELVEWMRRRNAEPSHRGARLRFYGFDSPTEMTGAESPRRLLHVALDYLASIDHPARAAERRKRVDELLGPDADWENPAATFDPGKAIGRTDAVAALRIEAQDLITELRLRRPDIANDDVERYDDALQHAKLARQMLNYHAGLARTSDNRIAELLGLRDLMMADNLAYIASREHARGGKVLAFAHNSHLKRGRATWQLGPHALAWWPAGAHLAAALGGRYAVIGSGVGTSAANGIASPEPGTLEARLIASPGPARFISTHQGRRLRPAALADLPQRTASVRNQSYFPFTPQSFTDFDALAVLDSVTCTRGAPALP